MLLKCYTQYASKFGKLSSGHGTGKDQFSCQSQRKAMPKNAETAKSLHSFYMFARSYSKSSKVGFNIMWTEIFQVFKVDLEKVEKPEEKIANIHWIIEKAGEFQESINFCFIDLAKAFDCVDHNKLWKILQEMGKPDHLTCLLKNLYAGQEATVRTKHGSTDLFKIGKEYVKALYYHPVYLTHLRVRHAKRQAGCITSWNQDFQAQCQ